MTGEVKRFVIQTATNAANAQALYLTAGMTGNTSMWAYGCIEPDGQHIKLSTGQIVTGRISGRPAGCGPCVKLPDGSYAMIGPELPQLHIDSGNAMAYALLCMSASAYLCKLTKGAAQLYTLDLTSALGRPPQTLWGIQLQFSSNGRHIFICDSEISGVVNPGQVVNWTWLQNWSLGTDTFGNKIVKWKNSTNYTITLPLTPTPNFPDPPNPKPVTTTPPTVPGVPNPYVPSTPSNYRIQWELETDTNTQINPQRYIDQNNNIYQFYNYVDKDGLPHTIWYGTRTVTRTTQYAFRPKYCYNGNFTGNAQNGTPLEVYRLATETDTNCPVNCSSITYFPSEIDKTTSAIKRRVRFLAGFINDVRGLQVCPHDTTLPPVPIWYDGYICMVTVAPSPGNNPLGPGNCKADTGAHTITSASDVCSYNSPFGTFFKNANTIPPALSKDGTYTNWTQWQYPSSGQYKPTVPPAPILDGCQPTPTIDNPNPPPVYVQPPYLYSIPNIFCIPFQWSNSITQNYLWTCVDQGPFNFLATKSYTATSTESSPVTTSQGANQDLFLCPLGAHIATSGSNWQFGAIYEYYDSTGKVHISTTKGNNDVATFYAGVNLGPFEWYLNESPTLLTVGKGDQTIPAQPSGDGVKRLPRWVSDQMLQMTYVYINYFQPPTPIPLEKPLVPPFIVQDPSVEIVNPLIGVQAKLIGPQTYQTSQPGQDQKGNPLLTVASYTWDDTNAVLKTIKSLTAPQWDQSLGLNLCDTYIH